MKKLSFDDYVVRAKEIHGEDYKYLEISALHVKFECPVHEEQEILKSPHLRGQGCPACGAASKNVRHTLSAFIEKANLVHAHKYTYESLQDGGKIKYICQAHGEVVQSRSNHLQGTGCPRCGRTRQAESDRKFPEMEAKLKAIHGNKYHFLSLESGFMTYLCPSHGEKIQKYADMLKGMGCAECSNKSAGNARIIPLETYLTRVPESTKQGLTYVELDSKSVMFTCSKHGEQVQAKDTHRAGLGCPRCVAGSQISRFSSEVSTWLTEIGIEHELESSKPYTGTTFKADILVGNLVVELNGDYWHSEDKVGRARHKDKYDLATKSGYDFIMFSDNEWAAKKELIKSAILTRLGLSKGSKVGARQLTVTKVDYKVARELLDKHHIQGATMAGHWFGLTTKSGEVVAVAGFSMKETGRGKSTSTSNCELVRYCTSQRVVGGLSKLVNYANKALGFSVLNTFSDARFFSGGIYSALGFKSTRKVPPSYYYVKSGKVINKASLQKSAFASRPDLLFDASLTERELAELNGYKRVYDAGKVFWSLSL